MTWRNRQQAEALRRGLAALQKQEAEPDVNQLVREAVAREMARLPVPGNPEPRDYVASVTVDSDEIEVRYSDGRRKVFRVESESAPPVSVVRIFRKGDELLQELSTGRVIPIGPIHDGVDGLGQDGAGVAKVLLTDQELVFTLTTGDRLTVSLQPLLERLASSIELPSQDFLQLDAENPFTVEGGKLLANHRDGARQLVAPLPKAGGGGVSQARARAISRRIAFTRVTEDYTAQPGDDVIEAVSDDQAITITVPAGRETWLQVKRSGSNNVTVTTDDGSLIEGETERILNLNLWALRIAWNGTQYREF